MHRSHEDTPGHMNTGIEWPVYAAGNPLQEEVARLRGMMREYLLLGYVENSEGVCADCELVAKGLDDLYMHEPDCLYNRLCVAVGLQSWAK